MSAEASSQRNEFHGNLSNERGLFMAGAQLITGGGNINIFGGGHFPHSVGVPDDGGKSAGSAASLLESEGLCVLCFGERVTATSGLGGGEKANPRRRWRRASWACGALSAARIDGESQFGAAEGGSSGCEGVGSV